MLQDPSHARAPRVSKVPRALMTSTSVQREVTRVSTDPRVTTQLVATRVSARLGTQERTVPLTLTTVSHDLVNMGPTVTMLDPTRTAVPV